MGRQGMIETLLDDLTAAELIDEVYVREDAAEDAAQRLYEAQAMLIAKMTDNGATEATSETNIAKTTAKPLPPDELALRVLLETEGVTPEELTAEGAFIPAHWGKTPWLQDKWNMTKANKFKKRSTAIRDVIEGARRTGRTTVRVTPIRVR